MRELDVASTRSATTTREIAKCCGNITSCPYPHRKGPKEAHEVLNSLGENGWELVSAYMDQDSVKYVFKKAKQEVGRATRKGPSEG